MATMDAEAHERALTALFMELKSGMRNVDRETDPEQALRSLKDLGSKMTECKRLIREFEKEARADGQDANAVQRKKTDLVNQLNKFVAQKKKKSEELETKKDLMAAEAASGGAAGGKGKKGKGKGGSAGGEAGADGALGSGEDITNQMSTQQLMSTGRRTMSETEKSIQRSARVVEDTIAIGQQTAAMLSEQTHQMEKIVNDLDEIQFSMKKAKKLIGDITRSMATDKCILMILMLIVGGIVVVIILKVAKVKLVKGISISVPLPTSSPPPPTPPPPQPPSSGHRKLLGGGRGEDGSNPRGWDHVASLWLAWLQAHLQQALQ